MRFGLPSDFRRINFAQLVPSFPFKTLSCESLALVDPATLNETVFAISLEPQGGSPTGAPTGPVLYTGKLVTTLPGHSQAVTEVAYGSGDNTLASGAQDGDVRLWNISSGQTRITLK